MPDYTYVDQNYHAITITEPMVTSVQHICAACGLTMWRKPCIAAVNWGGLKPSAGEMSNTFKNLINGADERRDKYEELHGGE